MRDPTDAYVGAAFRRTNPTKAGSHWLTDRPQQQVSPLDHEGAIGRPVGRHWEPVRDDARARLQLASKLRLQPRVDAGRKKQRDNRRVGQVGLEKIGPDE